jgi:hypothetical protein
VCGIATVTAHRSVLPPPQQQQQHHVPGRLGAAAPAAAASPAKVLPAPANTHGSSPVGRKQQRMKQPAPPQLPPPVLGSVAEAALRRAASKAAPTPHITLHRLAAEANRNLTGTEEKEQGSISAVVLRTYVAAAGGVLVALSVTAAMAVEQGSRVLTDLFLGWWATDRFQQGVWFYIGVYAALGLFYSLATFVRCARAVLTGRACGGVGVGVGLWVQAVCTCACVLARLAALLACPAPLPRATHNNTHTTTHTQHTHTHTPPPPLHAGARLAATHAPQGAVVHVGHGARVRRAAQPAAGPHPAPAQGLFRHQPRRPRAQSLLPRRGDHGQRAQPVHGAVRQLLCHVRVRLCTNTCAAGGSLGGVPVADAAAAAAAAAAPGGRLSSATHSRAWRAVPMAAITHTVHTHTQPRPCVALRPRTPTGSLQCWWSSAWPRAGLRCPSCPSQPSTSSCR